MCIGIIVILGILSIIGSVNNGIDIDDINTNDVNTIDSASEFSIPSDFEEVDIDAYPGKDCAYENHFGGYLLFITQVNNQSDIKDYFDDDCDLSESSLDNIYKSDGYMNISYVELVKVNGKQYIVEIFRDDSVSNDISGSKIIMDLEDYFNEFNNDNKIEPVAFDYDFF